MKWYLKAVRDNYANFNGRASRQEYWMFFLFNFIFISIADFGGSFIGLDFLVTLYCLPLFIPSLAVGVRRLHDIGKSAWWLLIPLIPIIGYIWILVLLCTDSNPNENNYGPSLKVAPILNEETS